MKLKTLNSKRTYGFTVASYDRTKDLIIDPLLASSYLGGANWDAGNSIAIDSWRNIYVTGAAWSTDFPTTSGAYDTSYGGQGAFVSKFNSDLTSLLASTYLGGIGGDLGKSVTVDSGDNIYVTGMAGPAFPTTPDAYDTSFNKQGDAFVSKLDSGLTSLLASTYLGGTGGDRSYSIAISSGGKYICSGLD